MTEPTLAIVVPCYRVHAKILETLARIGPEAGWIFVVDDACPEKSGDLVERECRDARVRVLRHAQNKGVGGAVMTGYRAALETPARAIVKLDGDGQMDPALVPALVRAIAEGRADYVKGNRYYRLHDTAQMPTSRLFGNAAVSFLSKLSSGYWQVFDPTNGFTAIHREVLALLPLDAIAERYFFESDMLYQLNQLHAVVADMPMRAHYADEQSSLRPMRVVGPFAFGHLRNLARRVVYSYFVRGFSLASVELALGVLLTTFGVVFGAAKWWTQAAAGVPATAGTVMLAALPIILGVQMLLSWLNFDVMSEPRQPIHRALEAGRH